MEEVNQPLPTPTRKFRIFTISSNQHKTKDSAEKAVNKKKQEQDAIKNLITTQRLSKKSIFGSADNQKRSLSLENNRTNAYSYNVRNHITTEPCANLCECNLLASEKSQTHLQDHYPSRKRISIFNYGHQVGKNEVANERVNPERKSIFEPSAKQRRNQSLEIRQNKRQDQSDKVKQIQAQIQLAKKSSQNLKQQAEFQMEVINQVSQRQPSKIQQPQQEIAKNTPK